jgi:hypothetical protein
MTVLPWRRYESAGPRSRLKPPTSVLTVGAFAGRARFRPGPGAVVTPTLTRAIGQVLEVGFAGIAASGEIFAGQALYLEWRSDRVLNGFLIPEQDLEFLDRGRSVSGTSSFPAAGSTVARSGDGAA